MGRGHAPVGPPGRGTGLSRPTAFRAGLLAAAAAAWLLAAWLLWQTAVPGGLHAPAVPAGAVLDRAALAEAESYERFLRVSAVLSLVVLLLVLSAYAWRGAAFAKESAAGRIGTGMLLGMLGLGLVWLAQAPFRLADVWWQRRHEQTEIGYAEALLGDWVLLGAEFLFVCLALLVVMAAAGRFPRRWWLAAAPTFVALGALFAFVLPYLVETEAAPAHVRADALRFAAEQRDEPVRIAVEDVSSFTTAPNAYAAGFGPSKRIVLWSTLLDGRFSDGEVRTVLAHELGHHWRNHVPEGIAWYALFALPGTWLVARWTRRRGGMGRPEAVPLGLLLVVALQLASLPFQNAVSRHMEREADWVALETTNDPASARALFRHFASELLVDPDPPAWARLAFDSHPSIVERLRLVEAWRRARRG